MLQRAHRKEQSSGKTKENRNTKNEREISETEQPDIRYK